MRRTTKIWLILAGILTGAGLLILTVGASLGGVNRVADWAINGELTLIGSFGGKVSFDKEQTIYEGSVPKTVLTGGESADKLLIRAGSCMVNIEASGNGNCYFSSDNAYQFQCYVEDNELQLRVKSKSSSGGKTRTVTLYLPEGMYFSEISVSVGAGQLKAQELCADEISADVGAGKMQIARLSAHRLKLEVSAGTAVIENAGAKEAEFEVSAGKLTYEGTITGDLEADCSAGKIDILLDGRETDHNYDVDCSAGSVTVGGTSYSGASREMYIHNGAESKFELNCSAGKISVSFR